MPNFIGRMTPAQIAELEIARQQAMLADKARADAAAAAPPPAAPAPRPVSPLVVGQSGGAVAFLSPAAAWKAMQAEDSARAAAQEAVQAGQAGESMNEPGDAGEASSGFPVAVPSMQDGGQSHDVRQRQAAPPVGKRRSSLSDNPPDAIEGDTDQAFADSPAEPRPNYTTAVSYPAQDILEDCGLSSAVDDSRARAHAHEGAGADQPTLALANANENHSQLDSDLTAYSALIHDLATAAAAMSDPAYAWRKLIEGLGERFPGQPLLAARLRRAVWAKRKRLRKIQKALA